MENTDKKVEPCKCKEEAVLFAEWIRTNGNVTVLDHLKHEPFVYHGKELSSSELYIKFKEETK